MSFASTGSQFSQQESKIMHICDLEVSDSSVNMIHNTFSLAWLHVDQDAKSQHKLDVEIVWDSE